MMGLISKFAGPRVLLGITLSGLGAIVVLTWLLFSARDDAAEAESQNRQLKQVVAQQSQDHSLLRSELDRRDRVVSEAIDARDKARAAADAATNELSEALADDECANTAHPDAVTRSLRQRAGDTAAD